jgi:FKBP-type peptidyl-prolyl cis-trans isomerase SlyD
MKVAKNLWVSLTYNLLDSEGQALEEPNQQVRYLHGGYGVLFPKLEQALEGKKVGESVTVYLEPPDHFGEYDALRVFIHPLADFDDAGMGLALGDVLDGRPGVPDDGGQYYVIHIAQGTVVLDGNHPYAEMALCYQLTITSVEVASEQDIAMQAAASAAALQEDDEDDLNLDIAKNQQLH